MLSSSLACLWPGWLKSWEHGSQMDAIGKRTGEMGMRDVGVIHRGYLALKLELALDRGL